MQFGKRLSESVIAQWRDKYIDYSRLKALLREHQSANAAAPWTEQDESRFCDELFNVQLEKVWAFQLAQMAALQTSVDQAFERLQELAPTADQSSSNSSLSPLREVEAELDAVMAAVKQLRVFARLNYTGFLKIAKKHDRRRGDRYKVRPLMQLSLARRPFSSDRSYAPILNKLSVMYFAIRQLLEEQGHARPLDVGSQGETRDGELYTSYKYWVHPDNLLEVKTFILRRLPALVYRSLLSSDTLEASEDPTVTSVYFDNDRLDMYTGKLERQADCSSVRLRWYGQLDGKTDIYAEKKTQDENGNSHEAKFTLREKYVQSYLAGQYNMEKAASKMTGEEQARYKATVGHIQGFIRSKDLRPIVRANYVRTAFQKPGDSRIRISIDTDLAFIREAKLMRPGTQWSPVQWQQADIGSFEGGTSSEAGAGIGTSVGVKVDHADVSRFPFAVLEIKLKEDAGSGSRRRPVWVEELMGSHLVHATPHFSKFVHAVAMLLDDQAQALPFWLSDLGTDIRRDPHEAFEEEEERRARQARDDLAIECVLGINNSPLSRPLSRPWPSHSPMAAELLPAAPLRTEPSAAASKNKSRQETRGWAGYGTMIPILSQSRYRISKRGLPAGVEEPQIWIKNAGELKVEPKVWLANERTFLKWQHTCVLLGSLAGALYAAAGPGTVAEAMGVAYVAVAAAAAGWGYGIMRIRRNLIVDRSGRDFDFKAGPLILGAALILALGVNLYYQWRVMLTRHGEKIGGVSEAWQVVGSEA